MSFLRTAQFNAGTQRDLGLCFVLNSKQKFPSKNFFHKAKGYEILEKSEKWSSLKLKFV